MRRNKTLNDVVGWCQPVGVQTVGQQRLNVIPAQAGIPVRCVTIGLSHRHGGLQVNLDPHLGGDGGLQVGISLSGVPVEDLVLWCLRQHIGHRKRVLT